MSQSSGWSGGMIEKRKKKKRRMKEQNRQKLYYISWTDQDKVIIYITVE